MPKSVEIADFSTKLGLLAKQLDWSRAKLAQRVGVDKSIAARWLTDRGQPTTNNLMQLTRAVAEQIVGFAASDWDLPLAQFGKRLGLEGEALLQGAGGVEKLGL